MMLKRPHCQGVSKFMAQWREFYRSVWRLWVTKQLMRMGAVRFKRTFLHHIKSAEGHHEFWFLSRRKLITWCSFRLGIRTFYAQSHSMSPTLTVEMGTPAWRHDHQKETSLKKKQNLMASSVPAIDVTVSLGEGSIWLHSAFNDRIKSLLRRFCRAASI